LFIRLVAASKYTKNCDSIIRVQAWTNGCSACSVKARCLCRRHLAGPRVQQITELEDAIDPSPRVECKIKENRSAIPLFTIIFTPKARYRGILFRYLQASNGIRDNNGMQFLYSRATSCPSNASGLYVDCTFVQKSVWSKDQTLCLRVCCWMIRTPCIPMLPHAPPAPERRIVIPYYQFPCRAEP
jgi:hypothetical protein